MSALFKNPAGQKLLESLRDAFKNKPVYHRKNRFIVFVCGGRLDDGETSLRKQFIEWADDNLTDFICLIAEEALKDSFAGEGLTFVNLAKFESVIAEVSDCVLIFPESAGSFAETGFFANSDVRKKTLIVNPLTFQTSDSFLNLGPIDTISAHSFLKPTVLISAPTSDFTPIGARLRERVKGPDHRERLPYQAFGQFNFKQKLLVVFEITRLLRLTNLKTLQYVIRKCFGGNPTNQELKHLLRILIAAKFIRRDGEYFRAVSGVNLVEIENMEVERVLAQIEFFYKKHSKELYEALAEVPS